MATNNRKNNIINKYAIEKISTFLEIYSRIEVPKFVEPKISAFQRPESKYSKEYIEIKNVLKLFVEDFYEFNKNNTDFKYNIVSKYYNGVSGKIGLLLENGLRIEDNEFIDKNEQDNINKKIDKIISNRIEYILDSSKRTKIDRLKKLNNILK